MKMDMKKIIKILVVVVVIAIIILGIVLLSKKNKGNNQEEINKKVIVKIEYIANKSDLKKNSTVQIYENGQILKTEEGKKEKLELSKEDTGKLIELIDKVDKNSYTQIDTFLPIESGYKIIIYTSKDEEILIKDFYKTNNSEAGMGIFKLLQDYGLFERNLFM